MIEMYRCKGCGYLHVGPAPEKCPVCGAPQAFFVPAEPPGDLNGTETMKNLRAAFAGESQANRRYTLFARIAELEGNEEARAAVEGEECEAAEMYPEFARIAEDEGYPDIAHYFRAVGGYERLHRDAFAKAQD